jgi:uncharacterized caspase-like protein
MTKRKIGLVIGTNNYNDPGKNLEFAENDAREMMDVLSLCGFDPVIALIDKTYDAVRKKIEKEFKRADYDDLILIYFAGHGELDEYNCLYLELKDSDPETLLSTSLSFDFIDNCIRNSKCKTVIVIIDSCYSGAAVGQRGSPEKSLEKAFGEGKIILYASSVFETVNEDQELQHGVFTYYLLEGLGGVADLEPKDRKITIDELYNYAFEKNLPLTDTEKDIQPFLEALLDNRLSINVYNQTLPEILLQKKGILKLSTPAASLEGAITNSIGMEFVLIPTANLTWARRQMKRVDIAMKVHSIM